MPDIETLPHDQQDLKTMYARRFGGRSDYRQSVWRILTSQFFSRWISPSAVVLDLGCGYCEFIANVWASKRYGMDLNPDARLMADRDVELLLQDCSAPWSLPDNSLDVVFTSNFFEHLPTKEHLEETLQQALRCLKPGGRLIALGPNIRFVPGKYWDFFDHYLPLTEKSLAEAMEKNGFQIEVQIDRFLPYTMSAGFTPPLWTLRLYLHLPLLWKLRGKQFLIVAVKP
jgi:SAM-dependent methyltransferase